MSLFQFEADRVIITADLQEIKVFSEIMKKKNSDAIISYIFHLCDWKSPYASYDEDERAEQLSKDFLEGKKPTKLIQEGVEKYKILSETPSLKLLNAARKGAKSLQTYFEEADPANAENPGREAKDLMVNLEKLGSLLNKFEEWEQMLLKEKDTNVIRKGVKLNKYNT
jgi:hypothetical protein